MFTSKTPMSLDEIRQFAPSALATQAHGSRTDRYEFIPTVEVIRGLQHEGFEVFAASESRTRMSDRNGFLKHMLRFRHASMMNNPLAVGDTIPEVVLVNSHDGSSVYNLMGGLFRLVCSNGMIVADSLIAALKVRHTGDVVAQVIEASFKVAEQSRQAMEVIGDWQRLLLTSAEQNSLAIAAHHVRFADSDGKIHTPIRPEQLLQIRRSDDRGNDLWSTFNRVQENVIKGGLTARGERTDDGRRGRRISTREVKGIDGDVKLNRALWVLADALASHKKGQAAPVTIDGDAFAAAAGE